jgi:two-component system, chemotaxis family, response regulator PixG
MNSQLFQELRSLSQSKFSGCLIVNNSDAIGLVGQQTWKLFFYQGNMIGDGGGIHPVKRWQHCLNNEISKFPSEIDSVLHESSRHDYCSDLLMQKLLVKSILNYRNVQDFISNSMLEVLFDIYQQEIWLWTKNIKPDRHLTYQHQSNETGNPPYLEVTVQTEHLIQKSMSQWQTWQAQGLMWYSPQLSPYLVDRLQLQQSTTPDAYLEMIQLVDGQQTLRDIAIKLKQDIATLTASFLNGKDGLLMGFQYLPDDQFPASSLTASSLTAGKTVVYTDVRHDVETPMVGALIDSELELHLMQQIALIADYGYVGLQAPLPAVALFLQHCPQIIFLDLLLGDTSGYEICATLRRTPQFKDTPIILLTENQTLRDMMRGKMSGVTDFLPKPLEPHQILNMLKQYLLPD